MIEYKSIGTIITPWEVNAPHQPVIDIDRDYYLELKPEYEGGLKDLEHFTHIYVLFHMDKHPVEEVKMLSFPPWLDDTEGIGLFSSRSPIRPNPIGLSVVKIKSISGNRVYVYGIDAINGTPLLDIKPYFKNLDVKNGANNGWINTPELLTEFNNYQNRK
jgi:tRNA-Thr(GGU) m(6)t(6)A37 methyltransferase TsaA